MKKFCFRLRSVATLRSLREMRSREVFAAAVHAYLDTEARLRETRDRIDELERIMRGERSRRFLASDQVAFLAAHQKDAACEGAAAKLVERAKSEMERCRRSWLEARRDARLLENLETRARTAHRGSLEREEQSLLDDRTGTLAARVRLTAS